MRLFIFILLAYILYRIVKALFIPGKKTEIRRDSGGVVDEMVQDPFCKTYIPRREALRRRVGGREHFFCSEECARKFEAQGNG